MFALEALKARFGDALFIHWGTKAAPKLAIVDGGPSGVYGKTLGPALERLRRQRSLATGTPLPIALMLVSHLDADHVTGIAELIRELKIISEGRAEAVPWKIDRFWINTFDDLVGNQNPALTASVSAAGVASLGGLQLGAMTAEATALVATVPQARTLRDDLRALDLEGNKPFESLVMMGTKKRPAVEQLELTIVGPQKVQLDALQNEWDKKIKPLLKTRTKTNQAAVAAYLDRSVYNLSSIVVLAKLGQKRMLLTGDARGDQTLDGLERAGLLKKNRELKVDILKMPHHGSDRDVDEDYFRRVKADHYVISADGTYDNPDVATLAMLSNARKDDKFTIWLTNPLKEFAKAKPARAIKKFFDKERAAGRKYRVMERASGDASIRIDLA